MKRKIITLIGIVSPDGAKVNIVSDRIQVSFSLEIMEKGEATLYNGHYFLDDVDVRYSTSFVKQGEMIKIEGIMKDGKIIVKNSELV